MDSYNSNLIQIKVKTSEAYAIGPTTTTANTYETSVILSR